MTQKEERDNYLYKEYSIYMINNKNENELPFALSVKRFLRETFFFIEVETAKKIINSIIKDTNRRKKLDYEVQYQLKMKHEQVD